MEKPVFELRYSPLFYDDMMEIVSYISEVLKEPEIAKEYIDRIEIAIQKRCPFADSFPIYPGSEIRELPYRSIKVGNYVILYVVYANIMEVRRVVYNRRNMFPELI